MERQGGAGEHRTRETGARGLAGAGGCHLSLVNREKNACAKFRQHDQLRLMEELQSGGPGAGSLLAWLPGSFLFN